MLARFLKYWSFDLNPDCSSDYDTTPGGLGQPCIVTAADEFPINSQIRSSDLHCGAESIYYGLASEPPALAPPPRLGIPGPSTQEEGHCGSRNH